MNKIYILKPVFIVLIIVLISGCGALFKSKNPVLKMSPYADKTAFYGKVVDFASQQPPKYPIKLFLEPDDPGNHLVVDNQYFYIEDKDLEPDYDYTLKIRAQYYEEQELLLKYIPGKSQDLGIIQIRYIEPGVGGPFQLGPFEGFSPFKNLEAVFFLGFILPPYPPRPVKMFYVLWD